MSILKKPAKISMTDYKQARNNIAEIDNKIAIKSFIDKYTNDIDTLYGEMCIIYEDHLAKSSAKSCKYVREIRDLYSEILILYNMCVYLHKKLYGANSKELRQWKSGTYQYLNYRHYIEPMDGFTSLYIYASYDTDPTFVEEFDEYDVTYKVKLNMVS